MKCILFSQRVIVVTVVWVFVCVCLFVVHDEEYHFEFIVVLPEDQLVLLWLGGIKLKDWHIFLYAGIAPVGFLPIFIFYIHLNYFGPIFFFFLHTLV